MMTESPKNFNQLTVSENSKYAFNNPHPAKNKYLNDIMDLKNLFIGTFGKDFYFKSNFVELAYREVLRIEKEFEDAINVKDFQSRMNDFFNSSDLYERDKIVYSYEEMRDFIKDNYEEYFKLSTHQSTYKEFKKFLSKVEWLMDYIDMEYFDSEMHENGYTPKQLAFQSGLIPEHLNSEDKVKDFFKVK